MAEPEEKYPEAEEGKHYVKVPNPKHPTRLDWKCICCGCPNRGPFSRKRISTSIGFMIIHKGHKFNQLDLISQGESQWTAGSQGCLQYKRRANS
ncbi:unnamed protein product [Calypogeia fissa]